MGSNAFPRGHRLTNIKPRATNHRITFCELVIEKVPKTHKIIQPGIGLCHQG